jgi:hypothetical protein
MPRQARLDSPGTLHHLMIRGIEKKRIILDEQDRKDFVRRLDLLAVEKSWERNQTPGKTATACWPNLANEKRKRRRHTGAILPKEPRWGRRPELVGGSGTVGEWFAVKSQRRRRIEDQLMSGFSSAEHL